MRPFLLVILLTLIVSCGKQGSKVKPVSEIIQKIWIANIVKENNSVVFTKGGQANSRPGYVQFKLNVSTGAVSITEFEGSVFTGTWELSADEKKLILKNLSPQPTGTSGIIEYTISSVSETQLNLSRTSNSLKTGNASTSYELVPQ